PLAIPLHSTLFLPFFFFFHDTASTELYTLSLHDALPICGRLPVQRSAQWPARHDPAAGQAHAAQGGVDGRRGDLPRRPRRCGHRRTVAAIPPSAPAPRAVGL